MHDGSDVFSSGGMAAAPHNWPTLDTLTHGDIAISSWEAMVTPCGAANGAYGAVRDAWLGTKHHVCCWHVLCAAVGQARLGLFDFCACLTLLAWLGRESGAWMTVQLLPAQDDRTFLAVSVCFVP
jgi:hypothetical protein